MHLPFLKPLPRIGPYPNFFVYKQVFAYAAMPNLTFTNCFDLMLFLKDKSGVGIIVDYSRDYTVVNGV